MTTALSLRSRLASLAALVLVPLAASTCKLGELTQSGSSLQQRGLSLQFSVQPSSTTIGVPIAPAVEVRAVDDSGRVASEFDGDVTIALGGAGAATLSGTRTVTATAGIARFSDLSIDASGASYTLAASAAGLSGATSMPFNVGSGGAARLAFTVQPRTTAAGQPITPAVSVTALDEFGHVAASFTGTITIALAPHAAGGTLSGVAQRDASSGVASFPGLSIDRAATGYELTASADGFPGVTSSGFAIVAGGGQTIVLDAGDLQTDTVGATLTVYRVRVSDASGNGVAGVNVTWAADSGGTITPTTVATNASGIASATRRLGTEAGVQTATATAAGLAGSPVVFTATARHGTPTVLAFRTQPSSTAAGAPITPDVAVIARDQFGNTADGFAGAVGVDIDPATGAPGAVLSGTTVQFAVAGVATFPGLSIDRAGAGYRLRASSIGFPMVSSALFVVTPGGAATLDIASGNAQTDTVGATLTLPYVARVRDAAGNPVSGVTITFTVTSGGGTMTPGSAVTDVNGEARSTRKLGTVTGEQRATAAAPGLSGSPVTFTATATPGAVTQLEFVQQPTAAAAGAIIAPPVQVVLKDQFNNTVTTASGSMSIGIVAGTGTAGAVLGGTLGRAVVNGMASFDDLRINMAGTGYKLGVTFGARAKDSAAFDITP